jgi:saccharopine dehydrogenase (NAD+, L-lysine-forming)
MKALVLGCGEMGEEVIRDLYRYGGFDDIVVGTRSPDKVERLRESLNGHGARVTATCVDAGCIESLTRLMDGVTVVVNCVGPNYRYEIPVARAAIQAGVNLVDLNDEFETTLQMFDLDNEAKLAGITVILGLGGSPGINNILVRAAANQLDEVEEIHTAWVMSAADPGGVALCAHLLHSLSGRALTYENGRMVEVQSFVDGKERIEFPPPVGPLDVYHVGHPEPIMLARSFPGVRTVDDKATFNPPEINELILQLGALVRQMDAPVSMGGQTIEVADFAASYLRARCKRTTGAPREAALLVQVKGEKKGKSKRIFFSSSGLLAPATGIPASIGAIMLSEGKITAKGVVPPEQCVEADDFLYEILTRRNVAKLNGWVED